MVKDSFEDIQLLLPKIASCSYSKTQAKLIVARMCTKMRNHRGTFKGGREEEGGEREKEKER